MINAVWISISDLVKFFQNPVQSRSDSEMQTPVGSRSGNRIMFNTRIQSVFSLQLPSISVDQIGDFCNPNPIQNFYWVIRSDPNPVYLSKYLIQSGLYPKNPLIKHYTEVINAVWISIYDPVEFFSKSSPIRIRFWIAQSGWIAIREKDHVQRCHRSKNNFPMFSILGNDFADSCYCWKVTPGPSPVFTELWKSELVS